MPAGPMKIFFCPSERRAKSRKADAEGWLFLGSKVPWTPAIRLAQPQAAGAVPDFWITPAFASVPRTGSEALLKRTQRNGAPHFLCRRLHFVKQYLL